MRKEILEMSLSELTNLIKMNEINLQPNFQRNGVWSKQKMQKLIDTIFRGWYVPPIHLIKRNNRYDVLDGQQRLLALDMFVNEKFPVKFDFGSVDFEIEGASGKYFSELEREIQMKFLCFSIECIVLLESRDKVISEMFYRLNDNVSLTASEKRNALYGKTKNQVSEVVDYFKELGLTEDVIGFSNDRLAYEDICAKLCTYIEENKFNVNVDNKYLSYRYSNIAFEEETIYKVKRTISQFQKLLGYHEFDVKFTKITLLNWLLFSYKFSSIEFGKSEENQFKASTFIEHFENGRKGLNELNIDLIYMNTYGQFNEIVRTSLLSEFNLLCSQQKVSSKNIAFRDLIIWIMFFNYIDDSITEINTIGDNKLEDLYYLINNDRNINWGDFLDEYVGNWGERI